MAVIAPGETPASELSQRMGSSLILVGDDRSSGKAAPSADAVAEARWARSDDDFVLGEGGHIVARARPSEIAAVPVANTHDGAANDDHFDIDAHSNATECGPSPATPAEITRLVIEAAQRHNVEVGLAVAVVTAESRLDRLRNSPKGARGPMQLMPDTAERFGVIDICDPEENIDGGVRYLRELNEEFRNPMLVAAAYNAGEGRVREHGGIPPFKETLGYVAEVVNIQMGLEESGSAAREGNASADNPESLSKVSGVITSRERRQWVGGVMHF
jgi:hypothetical protein